MQEIFSFEEVSSAVELHFNHFVYAQNHPTCYLKYTTEQMSDPLCRYVKNFAGPKEVLHRTCERLIVRIVETHRMYFKLSNSHCKNMLIHMLLYVAAKVAYSSGLPNTGIVVRLLSEIFRCDKNFKNLLMGAYYEPEICFMQAQVQSLFSSIEEGQEGFRYFLHHTNMARKVFFSNGVPKRMVDLSLQEKYLGHPAVYAIGAQCPETFKLLVEHGANLDDVSELPSAFSLLELIRWTALENDTSEVKICREIFNREHPEVFGRQKQTLMQLSRKAIRRHLNKSFQLPSGIEGLPIPEKLKRYLHLDFD